MNNDLALFALKKLTAMNPKLLKISERRLLQPVAPGFLSYFAYGSMLSILGSYTVYSWRGFGYKMFISKPVVPLIGLYVAFKGSMYGINFVREQLYGPERRRLAEHYRNEFGDEYLLEVLNPAFKLES